MANSNDKPKCSFVKSEYNRQHPCNQIATVRRDGVLYPRFAPSSKKCHVCGHVLATLSLSVREWTCPRCGDFHDRDLNAAKVIEQYVRDSLVLC